MLGLKIPNLYSTELDWICHDVDSNLNIFEYEATKKLNCKNSTTHDSEFISCATNQSSKLIMAAYVALTCANEQSLDTCIGCSAKVIMETTQSTTNF